MSAREWRASKRAILDSEGSQPAFIGTNPIYCQTINSTNMSPESMNLRVRPKTMGKGVPST